MSISPADGGFKNRHNAFTQEDFVSRGQKKSHEVFVPDKLSDKQRAVYATEDWITGLHYGLDDALGAEEANATLYECGREWGKLDAARFAEKMRHEFGGGKLSISQMNRSFVLESWWWPLRAMGYGTWRLDQKHRNRGLLHVSLHNSVIARSMQQLGKPVCHMSAGFFAGFFTAIEAANGGPNALTGDLAAVEVECYAMGHDCCQFLIGKPDFVRRAETWRRQGDTSDEIIAKLIV